MFKVLIADDESSVIHSLVKSVKWEDLGLMVAATAADGHEALKSAVQNDIDIAILDIRMPGINGLELCQKLRERKEHIQLIIISGYAEFAYAEKAIQYGVVGYCLKPVEYVQIAKFLRKAVDRLEDHRNMAAREALVEILESEDIDKIQGNLQKLGFGKEGCYVAVSVGEKKLEKLLEDGIAVRLGRGQWGYLMKHNCVEQMIDRLKAVDNWRGIGYISDIIPEREIYASLEECITRAFQFFVQEERSICAESDERKADRWMDAIRKEIRANRSEKVIELLRKIEEEGINDFSVRSALRLCNLFFSLPCFQRLETEYYVYSVEQMVSEYGNFRNMLKKLSIIFEKVGKNEQTENDFTNVALIKLIKYVDENYRNDISLSSAAEMLYMNPNYVSQMFKKGTGITFVHYVTLKRLDDAKELLTTTKKTLVDIALEVGFNDYFHFIKTFKRYVGMTPGQYRIQN